MKDNATFIEFATFFFIIAFSASMTKLQWDHKADLKQQKVDKETEIRHNAEDQLNWQDRYVRIISNDAILIKHDGDPGTTLIDVTMYARYRDPEKDDLVYEWTYLNSWDNKLDKERIFIDTEPDFYDSDGFRVDFGIEAGVHEFEVSVTDSYELQAIEIVTIEVIAEPNLVPGGSTLVFEKGSKDGCMDKTALNYDSSAMFDDNSCEYPKDPFKGNKVEIIKFQTENGLTPDGVWGPTSQTKFDALETKKTAPAVPKTD